MSYQGRASQCSTKVPCADLLISYAACLLPWSAAARTNGQVGAQIGSQTDIGPPSSPRIETCSEQLRPPQYYSQGKLLGHTKSVHFLATS